MSKVRDDLRVAVETMSDLVFCPTEDQRAAKAKYWAVKGEAAIFDAIEEVKLVDAVRITGDNRINKWWKLPGFYEWFANREEFRQKVEVLADLALDTLRGILVDPEAQGSAKVNAAKLIMEVANKLPKNQSAPKLLDAGLDKMSPEQLRAFIEKQTKQLNSGGGGGANNGEQGQ